MTCNNCGANAEGKYCNQCGQKLGVGRVSMHELIHDAWHGVTHTDKGVLKLIKDLTIRPRAFYRDYFSGKRKTYFSPVVFFLITAGLVVVLYPYVFDYEDKVTHKYNEFSRALFHLAKFRALALLPLQILLTWLFYGRRFNLAEITIFWLFVMGWVQTLHLVLIPLYFPLIHFKHAIDNIYTLISYALMIWQGMMLMKKFRWLDLVCWLIIVNAVYLADFLFQVYLLFGTDVLSHNPMGWRSVWDMIRSRYTW